MASMLNINGTDVSNPNVYNVSKMDIVKNAGRNISSGRAYAEYVATKYKIELKFPHLTQTEYRDILALLEVNGYWKTIIYINPDSLPLTTGEFYVSDRKAGTFHYDSGSGLLQWKDITFNLIER